MTTRPALALPAALAVGALLLAGCGSESTGSASGTSGDAITVQASFYPLQWMAEQVGGDLVEVSNLTPSGAEPHDLELTPRDVASLSDADVVAVLSSFQPAVDEAIEGSDATVFDAADHADLSLALEGDAHDHEHEGEEEAHSDEEKAHSEEEAHSDEEGGTDPHFWLDPTRLAAVGEAFADTLAEVDPDNAETYAANAEALTAELEDLDAEIEAGVASCESTDLVTSHGAFGYFADRYGFEPVGISGLSPDAEPSAGRLAELAEFVADNDVRTIYFETLVSPDLAETLASETGAETAVLDPIEGLTDDSEGSDYLEVMRSNLASVQAGQPCP